MNINTAVKDARQYTEEFTTNAFAIDKLAEMLDIGYTEAKELFYHHKTGD